MVVQHNLTAMNSNRMLGLTTASQAKSTEKLSSGYKINRAADDAAGLSISEKMRKQIRGLTQASLNAEDGISAVQTAEGALNEVQDMLQRMNELAVKAANGTNSEDDRSYIQNEIDQLVTEIDRVATTTKFNESYLVKGTNTSDGSAIPGKLTYNNVSAAFGIDGATGKATVLWPNGTNRISADDHSGIYVAREITVNTKTYAYVFELIPDPGKELTMESAISDYKNRGPNQAAFSDKDEILAAIKKDNAADLKSVAFDEDGNVVLEAFADLNDSLNFSLHVGADSTEDNKIEISIDMMSARGLGVNGLRVDGPDDINATNAIDTIAKAIQHVSTQRSALGAVQNRLEHTIANLDNVVENTTAAESQIRDTDMATEMVKYSNNNILAQAGQAMLAQANQSNQGVLSLLG